VSDLTIWAAQETSFRIFPPKYKTHLTRTSAGGLSELKSLELLTHSLAPNRGARAIMEMVIRIGWLEGIIA
jgi:hypothetical protein